jgi:hypothetical protein
MPPRTRASISLRLILWRSWCCAARGWRRGCAQVYRRQPGKDFHFLAKLLGKRDGGYLNLAVGTICSDRELYLGEAPPPLRPGPSNKVYSALIIEFTRHDEPDGSEWHGWTLKPEVKAALQHLGII